MTENNSARSVRGLRVRLQSHRSFVLEKFLRWRHAHEFENGSVRAIEPVGYLNLFAEATHNLIDGMLVERHTQVASRLDWQPQSQLFCMRGESVSSFSEFMLPFTAGGFIYIAGSDLLPELQKERKPWKSAVQFVALISGLMYLLALVG